MDIVSCDEKYEINCFAYGWSFLYPRSVEIYDRITDVSVLFYLLKGNFDHLILSNYHTIFVEPYV